MKLIEADAGHIAAHLGNHPGTQQNILVQTLPPQVEETVFQPQRLRRMVVLGDQERQHLRLAEHFHRLGHHFNFTGNQLRIDRSFGAGDHLAGKGDDRLHPPALQLLIKLPFRIDHHLGQAVMVAQVDKNNAAVVTHAVNPAGQFYGLADIGFPQFSTCVASIFSHFFLNCSRFSAPSAGQLQNESPARFLRKLQNFSNLAPQSALCNRPGAHINVFRRFF